MAITIKYKKEAGAVFSTHTHERNSGLDIFSNEDKIIESKHRTPIKTGLYLEIPNGYIGLIYDKGELALKNGLHIMSGVIDSNYKGELKIILVNLSSQPIKIEKGMKIAQLLIQKVENVILKEVSELNETERQEKTFCSSIPSYNPVLTESGDNIDDKKNRENKKEKKAKDDLISEIKAEIDSKYKRANRRKLALKRGLKEVKLKIKE